MAVSTFQVKTSAATTNPMAWRVAISFLECARLQIAAPPQGHGRTGLRPNLTTPSSVSTFGWWRVDRWQGLANRLRPELGEDAPQRADTRRERVTIILDDIVKLLGESGGFFV